MNDTLAKFFSTQIAADDPLQFSQDIFNTLTCHNFVGVIMGPIGSTDQGLVLRHRYAEATKAIPIALEVITIPAEIKNVNIPQGSSPHDVAKIIDQLAVHHISDVASTPDTITPKGFSEFDLLTTIDTTIAVGTRRGSARFALVTDKAIDVLRIPRNMQTRVYDRPTLLVEASEKGLVSYYWVPTDWLDGQDAIFGYHPAFVEDEGTALDTGVQLVLHSLTDNTLKVGIADEGAKAYYYPVKFE